MGGIGGDDSMWFGWWARKNRSDAGGFDWFGVESGAVGFVLTLVDGRGATLWFGICPEAGGMVTSGCCASAASTVWVRTVAATVAPTVIVIIDIAVGVPAWGAIDGSR